MADENDRPTQPFSERPTGGKGKDLSTYQALLSVFDELNDEERLDFIELAFLFKGLSAERRKEVIAELSRLSSP